MAKAQTIKLLLLFPILFSISQSSEHKDVQEFLSGKRITRSLEYLSSESDDFEGTRLPRNVRKPISRKPVNKLRTDASCDTETPSDPQPWSVDTGVVPESIQGGGPNDGLDGIAGTPVSGNPWSDIFNANPTDGDNPGTDNGGGSDWGNSNTDGGNNPGTDDVAGSDWGNTNTEDGGSDWGNENPESSTESTTWESSSVIDQEQPDCTCVSILACGGTFRSADVG